MKKIFVSLLFALSLVASVSVQAQEQLSQAEQPAEEKILYLDSFRPVASQYFSDMTAFRQRYIQTGGVRYYHGFELGMYANSSGANGYVEYDLDGKYKTLNFILGTSPSHNPSHCKGLFVVTADGKKVIDMIVRSYEAPRYMTLDVSGVKRLRFDTVIPDVEVAVVEPTLWRADQTPRQTGVLTDAEAKPLMLMRDYMPYRVGHTILSSNEAFHDRNDIGLYDADDGNEEPIRISGERYTDGINANADMALIGNNTSRTFFNLGGKFDKLRFIAGPIDTDGGTIGVGWLVIKADDEIIHEMELREGDLAKQVALDIKNCKYLSFETQQSSRSLRIGVANIMVYPTGYADVPKAEAIESDVPTSERIKALPDVCKLITNIPPYTFGGGMSREGALFTDESQFVTFSMGGVKFSEGLVLQSSTNFFENNTGAHAMFNLGGEFDYVSFTAGWVGKSSALKNDWLRIYADTTLIFQERLIATAANKKYVVPIYKCKRLTFEKIGMSTMEHPAFGLADMVVYRGEPVENDLFVHPKPETPAEVNLFDLGDPYIYKSSANGYFNGSSKRDYFTMPDGSRIYNGFILRTSVHFDIEMGPLSEPSVGIMAPMFGASMMVGMVGNSVISAVSPFGALLALASGGTAHEVSCAAFNTWGEYDYVTFTVACRKPHNTIDTISFKEDDPMEDLQIGADGEVVAEIQIHENMKPRTYTIPINRAYQLMFWLKCGGWDSGQFLFYDIKLTRGDFPKEDIPTIADLDKKPWVMTSVEPYAFSLREDAPLPEVDHYLTRYTGYDEFNDYNRKCREVKERVDKLCDSIYVMDYQTVARKVKSQSGKVYRAVSLQSPTNERYSFMYVVDRNAKFLDEIAQIKDEMLTLDTLCNAAEAVLPTINVDSKEKREKELDEAIEMMTDYAQKLVAIEKGLTREIQKIDQLVQHFVPVDGAALSEYEIYIE